MSNANEQMNVPHYDMLWVAYKEDPEKVYSLVIPFCEVANGSVDKITEHGVHMTVDGESIEISHEDFKSHIEKTLNDCNVTQGFPKRKIARLCVQIKETVNVYHLPI